MEPDAEIIERLIGENATGCYGINCGFKLIQQLPSYNKLWIFSHGTRGPKFKSPDRGSVAAPITTSTSRIKIVTRRPSSQLLAATEPSPPAADTMLNLSDDAKWDIVSVAMSCALAQSSIRNVIVFYYFLEKIPINAKKQIQNTLRNTPHLVFILSNDDAFAVSLCKDFLFDGTREIAHIPDVAPRPPSPFGRKIAAIYWDKQIFAGERVAVTCTTAFYVGILYLPGGEPRNVDFHWYVDDFSVTALRKLRKSAIELVIELLPTQRKRELGSTVEALRGIFNDFGLAPEKRYVPLKDLSFADVKIVALCFAFLCEPALLVLDDPSHMLDRAAVKVLINKINAYPHTILCQTNNITLIKKTKMRTIGCTLRPTPPRKTPRRYSLCAEVATRAAFRQHNGLF